MNKGGHQRLQDETMITNASNFNLLTHSQIDIDTDEQIQE